MNCAGCGEWIRHYGYCRGCHAERFGRVERLNPGARVLSSNYEEIRRQGERARNRRAYRKRRGIVEVSEV